MDRDLQEDLLLVDSLLSLADQMPFGTDGQRTIRQLLASITSHSLGSDEFRYELDAIIHALLSSPWEESVRDVLANTSKHVGVYRASDGTQVDSPALDKHAVQDFQQSVVRELTWRMDSCDSPPEVVPILFATDRACTESAELHRRFSSGRSEVQFGVAQVSIPDRHRRGKIEGPLLPFASATASRHVAVVGISALTGGAFADLLQRAAESGVTGSILLFIHGYNVSFDAAARRVAQICYDMNFTGIPLMYSWPSVGRWYAYTIDEENSRWTAPTFGHVVETVKGVAGHMTLHVLAHSMGNRLIHHYLEHQSRQSGTPFGEVMMAAPDIDADIFVRTNAAAWGKSSRTTLYASSEDWPLRLSKLFHGYLRAGDSGDNMPIVDGVQAIDASAVSTGIFGHAYYGDSWPILTDIKLVTELRLDPKSRPGLVPRHRNGREYWVYSP